MSTALLEPISPELVLVSPPDLARSARETLPDYERQFDEWTRRARSAFQAAHERELQAERRAQLGSIAFTALAVLNGIVALVVTVLVH